MKLTKNGIYVIAHPACVESMKNMGWKEEALQENKSSSKTIKKIEV
jgi:hypothetical protein|tara:strand:- start:302 stop:439 length:138 start_codon:yes stop_codon:yes gene_type:complete